MRAVVLGSEGANVTVYLVELPATPYRRLFRVESDDNAWAADPKLVERVAAATDPRAAYYGFTLLEGDELYLKINTAPQSEMAQKPHKIRSKPKAF